jgi:hypothetical protein
MARLITLILSFCRSLWRSWWRPRVVELATPVMSAAEFAALQPRRNGKRCAGTVRLSRKRRRWMRKATVW